MLLFFPDSFKFWAFKKDCKDIQHENMEILQLEVFVTVKVQAEQTQPRHWISGQFQTTWCVSKIPYVKCLK